VKKKENEQKKSKFQANDDNYKSKLKPNQGVNVLLCDINGFAGIAALKIKAIETALVKINGAIRTRKIEATYTSLRM